MAANGDGLSQDALALLDAVAAMSSDLELDNVLERIVASACHLTGARYGALGVVGEDDRLTEFITHGLEPGQREQIGDPPHGRGILGLLIRRPTPIRLPRIQDHADSFGFPANHPPMTTFLGVPLLIRGTIFGNLYLTEKQGGDAFTEQDQRLVEALASAAGVVIQNARAYALSERQRAWLEATARLDDALRPGADVTEALGLVAVAARTTAGALAVGVLHGSEGSAPGLVSTEGRDAGLVPGLVDDLRDEVGTAARGERPDPVLLPHDRIAVVVPLRAQLFGPVVMLLVLDRGRQDAGLGHTELELIGSFADQAGLALDRSRALADREQLAIVSDRDRIARDLHDLVIQRLFATGLQLQGVRGQVASAVVAERLDAAVAELDTTIREIRATIFALQHRGGGSLRAGVQALTREYADVLGFVPALRVDGPVDTVVPAPVAEQLVAVLREGLSNAARHARADHVSVEVRADPDEVVLRLEDDGVGLPSERAESGLANARRRAVDLGGGLQLARRAPSGTVLEWRVPLQHG
jgi:signal transduction histidine kinase